MKLAQILFPTDFSAHSDEALHTAEILARQSGAALQIVHVFDPKEKAKRGDCPGADEAKSGAKQRLLATMPAGPNLAVDHALLEGDTVDEIVRYASQHQVDLIVMGSHGRTGIPRVVLGSVTTQVVRHAACPVLTVRPKVRLRGKTKAWAHRKPTTGQPRSSSTQ